MSNQGTRLRAMAAVTAVILVWPLAAGAAPARCEMRARSAAMHGCCPERHADREGAGASLRPVNCCTTLVAVDATTRAPAPRGLSSATSAAAQPATSDPTPGTPTAALTPPAPAPLPSRPPHYLLHCSWLR